MTQLDTDLQQVRPAPAVVNPAVLGGPTIAQGIGAGISTIGDAVVDIERKQESLDQQRIWAEVTTQTAIDEAEARHEAKNSDPMVASQVYKTRQQSSRQVIEQVEDENLRARLLANHDLQFGVGAVSIDADSLKRSARMSLDASTMGLDTAIRGISADMTPAEMQLTDRQIQQHLSAIQSNDLIDADQYLRIRDYVEKAKSEQIRGSYLSTLKSDISIMESEFSEAINAPDMEPGGNLTGIMRPGFSRDVRDQRFKGLLERIQDSPLTASEKKELTADAHAGRRRANDNVATNLSKRVTLFKEEADVNGLRDLKDLVGRAMSGDEETAMLDKIDTAIKFVMDNTDDIDFAMRMYRGESVPEGMGPPTDDLSLNALYAEIQSGGVQTRPEIARQMLERGFRLAPKQIQDIQEAFQPGGNQLEGAGTLAAILSTDREYAERIAKGIGRDAEAGMRIMAYHDRLNIPAVDIRDAMASERFGDLVTMAHMTSGAIDYDSDDQADLEKGFDFKTYDWLGKIGKHWWLPDGRNPVSHSDVREFDSLYAGIRSIEIQRRNISTQDKGTMEQVSNYAREQAYQIMFGRPAIPTARRGQERRIVDQNLVGFSKDDKPAREAFQSGVNVATSGRASGQTDLNLPGSRLSDLSVYAFGDNIFAPPPQGAADRMSIDSETGFRTTEGSIFPIFRVSRSGETAGDPVGYLKWDPRTLEHTSVMREDFEPNRRLVSEDADSRVYDNDEFNRIDGMYLNRRAEQRDFQSQQLGNTLNTFVRIAGPYQRFKRNGADTVEYLAEYSDDFRRDFGLMVMEEMLLEDGHSFTPGDQESRTAAYKAAVTDNPIWNDSYQRRLNSRAYNLGWTAFSRKKKSDGRTDTSGE